MVSKYFEGVEHEFVQHALSSWSVYYKLRYHTYLTLKWADGEDAALLDCRTLLGGLM